MTYYQGKIQEVEVGGACRPLDYTKHEDLPSKIQVRQAVDVIMSDGEEHSIKDCLEIINESFELSPEQCERTTASGNDSISGTVMYSRLSFALSHMSIPGGPLIRVREGVYRAAYNMGRSEPQVPQNETPPAKLYRIMADKADRRIGKRQQRI